MELKTENKTEIFQKLIIFMLKQDIEGYKKLLNDTHFDINSNGPDDSHPEATLLTRAICMNLSYFVAFLLANGADVNKKYPAFHSASPLHAACSGLNGFNLKVIKQLINAGADVNFCNDLGAIPLSFPVEYQSKTVVQLLLEAGANIQGQGYSHPLLTKIKGLLEAGCIFVPMGNDSAGNSVYRLAGKNGKPCRTIKEIKEIKERESDFFKKDASTNFLISHSLFESLDNGVSNAMEVSKLATWLNKNDIRNAAEASALRDGNGLVINSELLKGARDRAIDNTREEMKSLYQ